MPEIILETICTGSDGNAHVLKIDDDYLFLDLGASKRKLQSCINYEMDKVMGAVVTHRHIDHYQAVPEFKKMGIPMFLPFEDEIKKERDRMILGRFVVDSFALTDAKGEHWTHTNSNGGECANYAFIIRHKRCIDDFNLLYATDCQYIKWKFPNLHNALIGVDYDSELLDMANRQKSEHQIWGHLSIDTACRFIDTNRPDQNVILTHLSATDADADLFKYKASQVSDCEVTIAKPKYNVRIRERN